MESIKSAKFQNFKNDQMTSLSNVFGGLRKGISTRNVGESSTTDTCHEEYTGEKSTVRGFYQEDVTKLVLDQQAIIDDSALPGPIEGIPFPG